jgi:hypothetical protein
MGIYASAVALWFMAVALFFIGASIRAWFRSPRSFTNRLNSSKADADDATLSNRLELGAENRCSGLFAIGKVVKFAFRRACFVRRQRGVVAIER